MWLRNILLIVNIVKIASQNGMENKEPQKAKKIIKHDVIHIRNKQLVSDE